MKKSILNDDAIIVIPVYKGLLNYFERIALNQLFNVLDKYPICIIAPENLCVSYNELEDKNYVIERFPNEYFTGTMAYSRLLLDAAFYERFVAYEYILIYQLDAFVFSDRLKEFCDLGFDYIGAPMKNKDWSCFHVGNGGFSLRKVKSTLELVKNKEIFRRSDCPSECMVFEDLFFGYCGVTADIDYRVPDVSVASAFCAQDDSFGALRKISTKGLPFGAHRWVVEDYGFWKPIIEGYGYSLPDATDVETVGCLEADRHNRLLSFIPYWFRHQDKKRRDEFLRLFELLTDEGFFIWGAGYYGKQCSDLLGKLGVSVCQFIDNNAKAFTRINDIEVNYPQAIDCKKETTIIIAVYGKQKEIEKQIWETYDSNEIKIIDYFKMLDEVIKYIEKEVPGIRGITMPVIGYDD